MFKKWIYTWLHHQFWNTTLPYFWRQTRRTIEERSSTESKLTRTNAPTPFLEHDHHHRTQMRCFEDLPTSKQNTNFLFSQIAACVHTHYLPNGTSRRKPVLYKNPKRSSEYERKKFEREIEKKKSHRFFSTTWSKKQVPWFYLVRWTQQVNRLIGSSTCRLNLAGESCPILPLQETTDNLCECLWSTVKILFCAGVSLFMSFNL